MNFSFTSPKIIQLKNSTLQLYIDPKNGATDQTVFLHSSRDDDVIELMKEHIHEGDHFVDIGANIGYETVYGASFVGKSGLVTAFEPLEHLANQLQKNASINQLRNVRLVRKALGNREGQHTIYLHAHDAGSSSLINEENSSSRITIDVIRLDDLPMQKIDFIKIDVEGFEPEVFLGAQKTILKDKPKIVFEFQPHLYDKNKTLSGEQLLELLHTTFGYSLSQMLPTGTETFPATSFKRATEILRAEKTLVNIFAH